MAEINKELKFILDIAKLQGIVARKLESQLGFHGLSFSDFVILYQLSQAGEGKLRRIDLAEKLSVTASGITRMLVSMEKMGLVDKETNARDARISYVVLTATGKKLLSNAMVTANHVTAEIFPAAKAKKTEKLIEIFNEAMNIL